MVKSGKRYYSSKKTDGNWFVHADLAANETSKRESCMSTRSMLSQIQPQALNIECSPKWKTEQTSRVYPFSSHDNRYALKDSIGVFTEGMGRRKCVDDRRQHSSHFCLCHEGAAGGARERKAGEFMAYQTRYVVKQGTEEATANRRFPRSHQQRSAERATTALSKEHFLWFGRHDSVSWEPLEVLAATVPTATHTTPPKKDSKP